jgi:hypothetical protein
MRTDPEEAIQRLLALLDLQGKVRLVAGASFWTTQADQTVGLRSMVLSDGAVGVRGERWDERDPSVALPSPTALAATWDEPLVKRLGGLLAAEARRKGVDILLTPTVNLHRTPLGGRHFECLSPPHRLPVMIGVHGGISAATAPRPGRARAELLAAGSAILAHPQGRVAAVAEFRCVAATATTGTDGKPDKAG